MKSEVLFNHNYLYPKYGTQLACPMVIIPMVVIGMSSLAKKEKNNNLGNMHYKSI